MDFQLKRINHAVQSLGEQVLEAQKMETSTKKMIEKLQNLEKRSKPIIEKKFKEFATQGEMLDWKEAGNSWSHVPNIGDIWGEVIQKFYKEAYFGKTKVYAAATL